MRKVSRILASWIVATSVGNVAVAGDDAFSPPPAPPSAPELSAPSAPSSGGVSLTDPISTAPKARAFDPFANDPVPTPTQSHSSYSVLGGAPKPNAARSSTASTTHADTHHAAPGATSSTASPFDDVPTTTHATQSKAAAWSAGSSHSSTTASPSASHEAATTSISSSNTAAGSSDPSQAPTVYVQWVKKSPIVVGQECQCDLVVRNTGKTPARDLAVDGFFPATVRLTHSDPMPADNTDHVTWSFAELGPSAEHVIHIKLVPSRRGALATSAVVRFASSAANTFSVEEPLLAVALRGPKELMVGDSATQTITINNPGTGVAHNVALEARFTKGLEAPRGEQFIMQVGSLNPGESRVVRLPLIAVVGGDQEVTISASAGNDLHREVASKIHVIAPSLKVAFEGPNFRYVGRKAHYVVTVTNDGGAPLNNVRVTHVVPDGFRFVRADHDGQFDESSHTVTWNLEHLDLHQSTPVKVELLTTQIGKCTHTVAAVAEQGARSERKLDTMVDGVASLAVEILKQSDPVEVGVETGFEIHVRNDGSKAAENVSIACDLPSVLEVVRTEGATSVAGTKDQLTFQPLPLLDPGKAAIYRVHVRAKAEGSHRFGVRLTADSIKEPLTYTELTKFYKD
ncbi:MAG TPA: hypothetical protein VFG04_00575 [Planctomycetaceae bacterium]|jgi:uncharacterized repeat protein (TIGR01451 family)|nr:hypothetical protein [Planctomycetaceae bacterium]